MKKVLLASLIILAILAFFSCSMRMMPSKDAWYAQHYFIMQDYERDAYRSLTEAGRLEFQKLFWEARAPEVRQEFIKRMDFITANFKRENFQQPWNTDRARIYLLNGRPAGVEKEQNDNWGMKVVESAGRSGSVNDRTNEDIEANTLEVWSYPFEGNIIKYGFTFQSPNKWIQTGVSSAGGRYMGDLERWNRTSVFGALDEAAYKTKLEEFKTIK